MKKLAVLIGLCMILVCVSACTETLPAAQTDVAIQAQASAGTASPTSSLTYVATVESEIAASATVTPADEAVKQESLVPPETDLRAFVLTLHDLPDGFTLVKEHSGFSSNQDIAQSREDFAKALALLEEHGRIRGYTVWYGGTGLEHVLGTTALMNEAIICDEVSGAQAYLGQMAREVDGDLISMEQLGDESMAWVIQLEDLMGYMIHFRVGNLLGRVGAFGQQPSLATVKSLARVMVQRIRDGGQPVDASALPSQFQRATLQTSTVTPVPSLTLLRGDTRRNPACIGDVFIVQRDSWLDGKSTIELELLSVLSGEEAWRMVQEASMFNSEPGEGKEYILAMFRVAVLEADKQPVRISEAMFDVVSADGRVYGNRFSIYLSGLNPALGVELYEGAEHQGWTFFLVDKGDTPVVAFDRGLDSELWFALRP